MNDNQKLFADIQRIIKHDRADNNGVYNAERACNSVAKNFVNSYKNVQTLAESFADYWLNTKILKSTNIEAEPTPNNIEWLLEAADFLDGTLTESKQFSDLDWQEIRDFVNAEATELPIDLLSSYMTIIVDNGAL